MINEQVNAQINAQTIATFEAALASNPEMVAAVEAAIAGASMLALVRAWDALEKKIEADARAAGADGLSIGLREYASRAMDAKFGVYSELSFAVGERMRAAKR